MNSIKFVALLLVISCWLLVKAGAMTGKAGSVGAKQEVFVGIFREGAPNNMGPIRDFGKRFDFKPATIMWYQDWQQGFPAQAAQNVIDYGAVPHIVWEAFYWTDKNKVKLKDVIAGKWDDYIRSWAKAVKAFGQPLFLRLGHEFNVEIYPWGIVNNDRDPQLYIKAYRHIVDVFKKEGVKNVRWVWSFNNYSKPKEAWNDWALAYPGDDYVDWIGIDGYNWGTTQTWSGWEDFKGLFRSQLRQAHGLWPKKPIMIAEFSSVEQGGDKAAWIKQLPNYLKSSLREIDAIIWFDVKKEADWRLNSSEKSAAAFAAMLTDPLFSSSGTGLAALKEQPPAPAPSKAVALKAKAAVNIDGNLADWRKEKPIIMEDSSFFKEGSSWGGLSDLSGKAYLMWDDQYLYFAAEITDNFPLINTQQKQEIWNGDAIELVINLKPGSDPKRTIMGQGDNQLGFGTGDGKGNQPAIWSWQRRREPEGGQIAVQKTSQPVGYILEAKIPWEFFRPTLKPAEGVKVNFDLAFDDADLTGERERQFIWNGDYYFYKDPSVWGILEFKVTI